VTGTFTVAGDENSFVWIRRFEDDGERDRVLSAVHQDPRCAAIADTLSALASEMASTVRLEPTAEETSHD
jgi:hypothetical protein